MGTPFELVIRPREKRYAVVFYDENLREKMKGWRDISGALPGFEGRYKRMDNFGNLLSGLSCLLTPVNYSIQTADGEISGTGFIGFANGRFNIDDQNATHFISDYRRKKTATYEPIAAEIRISPAEMDKETAKRFKQQIYRRTEEELEEEADLLRICEEGMELQFGFNPEDAVPEC